MLNFKLLIIFSTIICINCPLIISADGPWTKEIKSLDETIHAFEMLKSKNHPELRSCALKNKHPKKNKKTSKTQKKHYNKYSNIKNIYKIKDKKTIYYRKKIYTITQTS